MAEKVLFSWSGGKDSALALYEIKKRQDLEVVSLITTITEDYDRISMHGVRRVLLESQAESLGLPLYKIFISRRSSDEEYGHKMKGMLTHFSRLGVTSVVFGDILLADLRKFRETPLSLVGM
jgi:diphthamide synthase (EF-2-diphthine--ammonia ligase)